VTGPVTSPATTSDHSAVYSPHGSAATSHQLATGAALPDALESLAGPIVFAILLVTLSCSAPPDQSGPAEAELTIQLLASAIAAADTTVILELFWPEATYDDFAGQHTHQGIQEIIAYLTAVHGWGDDVYMNLTRVHASSTGAVGEWVFSAIQARPIGDRVPISTDREVVFTGVTIIEMEGERIIRAADYVDGVPLILQLGGRIELPGGGVWEQEEDAGGVVGKQR